MGCASVSHASTHHEVILEPSVSAGTGSTCFSSKGYVVEHSGQLEDFYELGSILGEGAYGSVVVAKHRKCQSRCAVKLVSKERAKAVERFRREMKLMSHLDHPNIVKISQSFEDNDRVYAVMELCVGGELLERVTEVGRFNETQAAATMQQVFRAVNHMHECGICHRDLKPQNFLYATAGPVERSTLKLVDFGLGTWNDGSRAMSTRAGTPYYMAPEVIAGCYHLSADVWSCGIILCFLLLGCPPFRSKTLEGVQAKVCKTELDYSGKEYQHISEDAKSYIKSLLRKKPAERITARDALNHSWLLSTRPALAKNPLSPGMVQNMQAFRANLRLETAALHVMATQLSDRQTRLVRDAFIELDTNGDGQVTPDELREGIARAGILETDCDAGKIVAEVDFNDSGYIDYTEFLVATIDKARCVRDGKVAEAFQLFDLNGDGKLELHEIQMAIRGGDMSEDDVRRCAEETLDRIDEDGDGAVSLSEFTNMIQMTSRQEACTLAAEQFSL